jgi:hypothetical protein
MALGRGEKVVVIIDEYDKPLLSTIEDAALHEETLKALKGFYGALKSADEYLRFVFLTGVTKFSHVSVFSDLNHLTDLSLNPKYADLCGITQEEMERDFAPEIDGIVSETGRERKEYLSKLKRFYNGYRFSKKEVTVYNPFGLLHHFNEGGMFNPYWFNTGTPTFLVNLIKKQRTDILRLDDYAVSYADFSKYDIETMQAVPVLYQAGYLTIAGYDEERNMFTLDYPNDEVRSSFSKSLLETYSGINREALGSFMVRFTNAVYDGEVDVLMEELRKLLKEIPHAIIEDREKYFQTAIHLIFRMLGIQCRSEVALADGRVDTLIETPKLVYCFEFKLDKPAARALKQIDTKEYLLPWTGSGKKLFKVGAAFSKETRNIKEWKWKEVD